MIGSERKRPNLALQQERKKRCWTQVQAAEALYVLCDEEKEGRREVSAKMLSSWERGTHLPSPFYQGKLCRLYEKSSIELGFLSHLGQGPFSSFGGSLCYDPHLCGVQKESFRSSLKENGMMEIDRYFTFGSLPTSEIILDGDGVTLYLPHHIYTHMLIDALILPEEFQRRKMCIAREQEERKSQGISYQWNGGRYNLDRFLISRDPQGEEMILHLWFRPSDYYTFLATSQAAQDPLIRNTYFPSDTSWDQALPLFAHSFSTLLMVITSDGYTLFVQRGKGLGCRPNMFDVGVAEGLSRPLDQVEAGQAPDIYGCALRGISEELGMHPSLDVSRSDLHFVSFAVDTQYCMWGIFGFVTLQRTREEVLQILRRGVRDRFEQQKLFAVPFRPEEVVAFIFDHQPFSPGGLVCAYHTLVHFFGKTCVNDVLMTFPRQGP